jgi:hypothetical protein
MMTNSSTDASASPAESVFVQEDPHDGGNEPIERGRSLGEDSCTNSPRNIESTETAGLSREVLNALRKAVASILMIPSLRVSRRVPHQAKDHSWISPHRSFLQVSESVPPSSAPRTRHGSPVGSYRKKTQGRQLATKRLNPKNDTRRGLPEPG